MWKCPKCGRTFKNENRDHYCGNVPKTVDEYILAQDEEMRKRLQDIRATIRVAIPEAEERISWQMPTYWKGRNIIHFSAGKNHVGIYPGPDAVEAFLPRLEGFKTSKGAIQFPNKGKLPLDLIAEIAVWSYARNAK